MSSGIGISRTKVIVPERRTEVLSRSRLLDLLNELLDKKLVLITAPAGYGKTSLLIDLALQSELPFCWLALDNLDQDPQRFLAYFIVSLSERFPGFGIQSRAALNSLISLDQDLERLLVTLVNEIYAQIHEHLIFVLDDYHLVDSAYEIQNIVNRFIQLADESFHLIIASRTLIALPDLPLMVARDQVGGLSFAELAFQADELKALFDQNYQVRISDTVAQELIQETEGWITGLQLSDLAQARGMADRLRLARASGVGLFEYLTQQVLDQQSPELREFLLLSSQLDEFNAELCEAVLAQFTFEAKDWAGLVSSVLRNNLFTLPVSADGQWLRYHHLFREFLQAQFKKNYPYLYNPILYRLAEVNEQRGEWDKAHHVYQQLGDFDALANLIEHAGTPLILNGRLLTLRNWLDNLPIPLIQMHPGLLSLQGSVACMTGDLTHGLSLLNQAESAFRTQQDVRGLALTLVRRAIVHRYLGNYSSSLKDVDEALSMTEGTEDLIEINTEAQRVKGLSLYRLGQVKHAIEWLERSLAGYTQLGDTRAIPMLLMETGMAYRALGNYEAAESAYEKSLKALQEEGNLNLQATLYNNRGVLFHLLGRYEKSVLAFEEGLTYAQRSGHVHMEALILSSLGDLYTELDEFEAAQKTYLQAQEIAQNISDRFLIFYTAFAQAGLSRIRKDYDQAHYLLANIQPLVDTSQSILERGLYHLEQGRLHLTEGDAIQAIRDLETSGQAFEQGGQTEEYAQCQLWLASALYQAGEKTAANGKLDEVLNLFRKGQTSHALFIAVWQTRTWLTKLRNDRQLNTAIGQLIDRADHLINEMPSVRKRLRRLTSIVPMTPPRLVIRALGPAQVKINNITVKKSDWQTQSVRDLFFYFVSTPHAMTKERIGVSFWPDIDTAKLKLRFKNEIYRLRRAVGQNTILFEDEQYYFNRSLDYDYDVEAFEAYLAQARSSSEMREQIDNYLAAVNLMRGPYLVNIDMAWVWTERERLSQEYLSATIALSELHLNNQQLEEALQTCQRALDYDVCFEDAHRLAMQIHAKMGNRPAIARQYQSCKDSLLRELDLPPSPETETLYQRLAAK